MKINKTRFKLRFEKFLKEELWQHILVIAFVFICAWLFDKYVEAFMFCVAHIVIRKYFDKQCHSGSIAVCMFITLSVVFFGIAYALPTAISLLSTIPVCFAISWIGYITQDRIDNLRNNKILQNELDNALTKISYYEKLNIYKMSETELRQYGASRGLSELQQDIIVMRVIEHLKISEICRYRNYGRSTIKYHIAQIKQKLDIETI